jgi:ribosomal protein S27E
MSLQDIIARGLKRAEEEYQRGEFQNALASAKAVDWKKKMNTVTWLPCPKPRKKKERRKDGRLTDAALRKRGLRRPDVPFKLHQCYTEPGSTMQVICTKCHHPDLDVGFDQYYTVVRCRKCGHEECIHDG